MTRTVDSMYDTLAPEIARFGISRRAFLQLAASAALAPLLADCTVIAAIIDAIKNRRVRKDISTLAATDADLVTFKQAVAMMKALPSSSPLSWLSQANIHASFCPHGNWLFLPWHRAYLYRFEEICRQLTGSATFALPYWNWTKNPQIPSLFFDTASPLYDATRAATPTSTISPTVTGQPVIDAIQAQPNFLVFASGSITATAGQRTPSSYGPLEGNPHNNIHGFVGGNMGAIALSPRDPIFWTHHNMVERIWVRWNFKGNPNTNDPAWMQRRFTEFYDRNGQPVSVTVFDMILYPLLTYKYDDSP